MFSCLNSCHYRENLGSGGLLTISRFRSWYPAKCHKFSRLTYYPRTPLWRLSCSLPTRTRTVWNAEAYTVGLCRSVSLKRPAASRPLHGKQNVTNAKFGEQKEANASHRHQRAARSFSAPSPRHSGSEAILGLALAKVGTAKGLERLDGAASSRDTHNRPRSFLGQAPNPRLRLWPRLVHRAARGLGGGPWH